MPSATEFSPAELSVQEFERQAQTALGRAREFRALAHTIRSISAPLTSAFDLASSRHLEGIWVSAAAARSRQELASMRTTCRSASETTARMAAALERAALDADSDARHARTRRDEEAAREASD